MENWNPESSQHSADLGRRAIAYDLTCDVIHTQLKRPGDWEIWLQLQGWIEDNLPSLPQLPNYKIDDAFIAFQYNGKLPDLDWLDALEQDVPGAKEVLKDAFILQKRIYDGGSDGASASRYTGSFGG